MRIVHIHGQCSRSRGISRYAISLAEGLAGSGHDVHYIHADPTDAKSPAVSFHKLSVVQSPHFLEWLHFDQASQRYLRRLAPDLTHTHGDVSFGDVVTAQSCHRRGMWIRRELRESRGPRNFGIVDALRLYNEKRLYQEGAARHVIAVSSGVKRELQEEYGLSSELVTVIPNGVDLNLFDRDWNIASGRGIRRTYDIPVDDIVLLIVANEFGRKGLHMVIDALSLLGNVGLWLLVAGADDPAPYRDRAERLGVDRRVLFLGQQARMEQIYAAADIFVMPTYYEAFSLATLEAAASGLPLVVTRVNGTDELVVDGVNGLFISRDPDDIASKVRSLLQEPQRLAGMSVRARESAEPYAWPVIVHRVLDLYSRLLRESR